MSASNPTGTSHHIEPRALARILRYKERLRAEGRAAAEEQLRGAAVAKEAARYAEPWLRESWLDACRGARHVSTGSLPAVMRDVLRRIEHDFKHCGTEIGVLVCRKCGELELGSGDFAVRAGKQLCNRPGCPLCDAEDRALRANVLQDGIDEIRRRAKGSSRKLTSYIAKMQKHRDARRRKGRRILDARKTLNVRIMSSDWYAFEVKYRYQVSGSIEEILEEFTCAQRALARIVARVWREKVDWDGNLLDPSALGAWIEQPALGTIVLRGAYFGPECWVEELSELAHAETPHAEVSWLKRIEPDQTSAWAATLSSGAEGTSDAATFAEGWFRNQPRRAILPRLALLWSSAAALVGVEALAWSYGLLRDYYRPIQDQTRSRRVEKGSCPACHAVVTFREQVVDTEEYLRSCKWLKHPPIAPRELPSEPEGYFPDSESEARKSSKRRSSSDDD